MEGFHIWVREITRARAQGFRNFEVQVACKTGFQSIDTLYCRAGLACDKSERNSSHNKQAHVMEALIIRRRFGAEYTIFIIRNHPNSIGSY